MVIFKLQHFYKKGVLTIILLAALFFFHQTEVKPAFACIPSGDQTAIQNALQGEGAQAVLCPYATFRLNAPIRFTAANQAIYTEGLPTNDSRAKLKITNSQVELAINGRDRSGIWIRNIIVNGNRKELGNGTIGNATIDIGGVATGQKITNVKITDPRSWSALLIFHGPIDPVTGFACSSATITDNEIGPAGWPGQNEWADGISLACKNSMVAGNTIIDATDGAIVIFGAAGSRVENNTIIARNRILLGGILAVDPYNTHGLVIQNNTINAEGAMIKIGVGIGRRIWGCGEDETRSEPGYLLNNTLTGQYFGYGYALRNLDNWTITGNKSYARHSGSLPSSCGVSVTQPNTSPFLKQGVTGVIQPEFQDASITTLYSVGAEPAIFGNWLPPLCAGTVFKGCGGYVFGAPSPVCSDYGGAQYPNWNNTLWGQCQTACSNPSAYCTALVEKSTIDLNMDGGTNLTDYSLFKTLYMQRDTTLDFKPSSSINALDYNVFKKIYRR